MSTYELTRTYLEVLFGPLMERVRRDERGLTAETIVLIAISLLGAAVVGGILWSKLKGGAEQVQVPAPAAP